MFSTEILLYVALGFLAQLVDGALGMAYGLIATSALLATGTPPALASASVHASAASMASFQSRTAAALSAHARRARASCGCPH